MHNHDSSGPKYPIEPLVNKGALPDPFGLSAGGRVSTREDWIYRINCQGGTRPFSFCVRLLFPDVEGKIPVIVTGDGCWWNVFSEEVVLRVLSQGCALAIFNRTEMAEDLGYSGVPDKKKRSGGLYDIYPGREFGAVSAWAWGYQRCVDFRRGWCNATGRPARFIVFWDVLTTLRFISARGNMPIRRMIGPCCLTLSDGNGRVASLEQLTIGIPTRI